MTSYFRINLAYVMLDSWITKSLDVPYVSINMYVRDDYLLLSENQITIIVPALNEELAICL